MPELVSFKAELSSLSAQTKLIPTGCKSRVSPFVIPVFIAHQGCPHQCLFCNQRSITGAPEGMVGAREVRETIRAQLAWPRRHPDAPVQVAFYGGSFTGLAIERQRELLGAAQPFLASGQVQELRLSTRPDYVTPEIAGFLREHGVGIVELGAQSLNDRVLAAGGRGHTAAQIRTAVACLKEAGIRVGLQLMLGLPGDSTAVALAGACSGSGAALPLSSCFRQPSRRAIPAWAVSVPELAKGRGPVRPALADFRGARDPCGADGVATLAFT